MTQTMEPARETRAGTFSGFSPKPKPCVAGAPPIAPASFSPKPKPCVVNSSSDAPAGFSPKPKPCIINRSSNIQQGVSSRLAPFERAEGGTPKALPAGAGVGAKPASKSGLRNLFRGMIKL